MIKRMSKATSLLVAAAAVVSLIPATGVNAAEKLETKSGTIEKAIAFEDGKYIFDGYRTSDDETGIYYNAGDKDKALEDIEDADTIEAYGTKYAKITENGGDEYLVDLTTGAILNDETSGDLADTLVTKLKSTLGKTDRYGKRDVTLEEITTGQFGETWYKYEATTSGAANLHGYVNAAGKYIDTDVTANIYVLNNNKLVKIEEFGEEDSTSKIKVDLVDGDVAPIAEDSEFIYRIVKVNITVNGGTPVEKTYLQKISKAQGEQKDEAYLPKSVASYEITNAFDSDDAEDANTSLADPTLYDFRVINGVIYATTKNNTDKVTVKTFKLKKDKVAVVGGTTTKLDTYLVEQDVNEDQDIMQTGNSVSIDVDGNTWALNKGSIYKFDGTEFKAVYSVDRAMDTLEVYNADSLLAWEDGEDVYATVEKATETPVDPTPVNKGWVKTASGWTFYDAVGTQLKGQWVNDGGAWYYIKADGVMATGWVKDGANWYFLNASGAMKTGWVKDGANWYYLKASGAMATGWVKDGASWYYLQASGAMAANTTIDGYKLGASGAWVK